MKKIKFLKEPGYTYDLFFLFMLCFNEVEHMAGFMVRNKEEEDGDYCNHLRDDFQPVSDDLLLFFYLTDGNRMFMTEWYFDPFKEDFATENYSLTTVLTALSDYKQVVQNVKRFYFRDKSESEISTEGQSLVTLNKWIRESAYRSDIKSALYSFFIDPVPMIQKLIYELMAKELVMAAQYEKGLRQLMELQENFDYPGLAAGMKQIDKRPVDIDISEPACISFCLNNNCLIYWCHSNGVLFLMLGAEYLDTIQYLSASDADVRLDVFGTAVSEKNRVDILNLIKKRGEITIKDIQQELGVTGTNAYYHLSLMIKAGMLKTRNQGRTVLYSIDKDYFGSLCDTLKKYIK